jgi:hypothetical protein
MFELGLNLVIEGVSTMSLALEDLIVPFDSRYSARPVRGSRQERIDVRRVALQPLQLVQRGDDFSSP